MADDIMVRKNSLDWAEIPVKDVGEAVVAALGMAGVEYLFFTSGSEICFYQEAVAQGLLAGRRTPKLITINHEHVGLNAALGYAAVSGKPAVTAVHVDAGTLHQGGAIHTAYRAGLPVLMTAGAPPTAYPGSMPGSRGAGGHIWMQQTYDQHSIVRQYVKWDKRLEYQDNPGLMVARALQIACSPPAGPVYLSLPSEVSFRPIERTSFPTLEQLGIARPAAPEPDGIAEIARRLVRAENPFVVVSGSGRNPATVGPLVALCERLGLPVVNSISRAYHCFPMKHPLYLGNNQSLAEADLVLVLDADVPWLPGPKGPPSDAYIAVVAPDPIKMQFPTYEFPANLRLTGDPYLAIVALTDAVRAEQSASDRSRAMRRAEKWGQATMAAWQALQSAARARAKSKPIDNLWLGHQIGEFLRDDDIVIDETLFTNRCCDFVRMDRPGSYFTNPGTSGGWSPGAALGAKFAAPDRDVIALTGDGFYMFGTPIPALWAAAHYKKPFMVVIYQNRSYSTSTARLDGAYPNAAAKQPQFDYFGGYFDPPIDFAKEAEAAGAYAENVTDPADIAAALQRGRDHIRQGIPAVVSVWLPKLLKAE